MTTPTSLILLSFIFISHKTASQRQSKTRIYASGDNFEPLFTFWEFNPRLRPTEEPTTTTQSTTTTVSPSTTTVTTPTASSTIRPTTRAFYQRYHPARTRPYTIAPVTTTVAWTAPTTVDFCEREDDSVLLRRLKDSGGYNEIYMASDFSSAVDQFPDMKKFARPRGKYVCDETCERKSFLVRKVFDSDARPPVKLPERTWWDQDEWEKPNRERRSVLERKPSKYSSRSPEDMEKRAKLESQIQNALRELSEMSQHEKEEEIEYEDLPVEDIVHDNVNIMDTVEKDRRAVRSAQTLMEMNTGSTKGVVGTTIAVECDDRRRAMRNEEKEGYHFCSSCRAVRQLPKNFFPRVLNEVICGEGSCIQDQGKCVQRFLPLKILHNQGTEDCPKWRLVNIHLRTCCDCILNPYSPFTRYLF